MRTLAALLLMARMALAQSEGPKAELVSFQGDGAALKGFLYRPEGKGPFPAVLWNHGSEKKPGAVEELGAFYAGHGFVFFIPHRHGQGRSPGDYIGDLVAQAPPAARGRKMVELQEVYLKDVEAAVNYLKSRPFVDPKRVAMSGVSYGGIQTVLAAEKGMGVRAFIAFAPGAMSWERNGELRTRLLEALRAAKAPVFLIQAENDYDLGPSEILGPKAARQKLYPSYGAGHDDGHYGFATKGEDVWGSDVLDFIDRALKPASPKK